MLRRITALGLVGLGAHSTSAHAFDFDPSVFSFNGFGTVGAVYSSEEDAVFTGPGIKSRGAGHGDKISNDVDTRLGVQAIAKFTDELTATVQVISEEKNGHYAPHFEWANVRYAITPDFAIRVGRTAMPSYLFSDSRKVGYALPWAREPHEAYNLLPITNSDGVDLTYKVHAGSVTNTIQAIYGENIVKLSGSIAKARDVWGIFNTVEVSDLSMKLSYQEFDLSMDLMGMTMPSAQVEFLALGFHYDPGQWFAGAEWAQRDMHELGGKGNAWYATAGYRFGSVAPYVIVGENNPDTEPFFNFTGFSTEQRSYTVGARWDFMRNFALKGEYQYVDLPRNAQGLLSVPFDFTTFRPATAFTPGGEVHLLTLSLSFVF